MNADYKPIIVVDTSNLSEKEWLEYRRSGIGGSDASAVLGVSPFTTCRDLYYDKLNIASAFDDFDNWVAKEVGHLLEDLVAKIFSVKTGYRIFQMKKMFRHPLYSFMLANLDYFIELPNGKTAILEIKTTNYNAKDKWWDGTKEIIPLNYQLQGQHYMAVMNIDQVYFCCLYGNNENEVIIRHLDRDLLFESELISLEEDFWTNHILAQVPPPYTENGNLVLKSVHRHFGYGDPTLSEVILQENHCKQLKQYLELQQAKNKLDTKSKELDTQMKKIQGLFLDEMGQSCYALCEVDSIPYIIKSTIIKKLIMKKDDVRKLQIEHPQIYQDYVSISQSQRFSVKPKISDMAA